MERLLGARYARQFELRALSPRDGGDAFEISGAPGRVVLAGTSNVAVLAGLDWYLNHVAGADLSWAGEQLDLPARLPAPAAPIRRESVVAHRFALNDTNDGYTGPYHDWGYWEHEIDLLALHGIDEVLVYPGQEAVYYRTFQEFGYRPGELRSWIPLPAHQPWWLLQNMCCFPSPITEAWIERRAALGRRIADRLRELGMTPVFPGYYGTVPPGFAERNPGTRVVPQGDWSGFQRPDWLDPRGAPFARVAEAF
jgi:alpha-N-acetylglucosaminidase